MQSVPNTMAEALALASEQEEEVSKINVASGEDAIVFDEQPIEEEA